MFRFGSQRFGNFLMATKQDDLTTLKALIEAGKVTPVIDQVFSLRSTAEAIEHVGRGHARGKVVISVASDAIEQEQPLARVA
jgi:NADPH:quinone reductase-like Zn-dependent oxidoreductase